LAPVAELPILEIVTAIHIRADLTLGIGRVVHDYLRQPIRSSFPASEKALVT
jgi:acetoacetate decarboxylase